MRDSSTIMKERQRTIRQQLDERNITLKTVSFDSGIPYSTLCSYFPGNERGKVEKTPAEMPAGAIASLCGVLPGDLLNAILPDGYSIIRTPEGIDFDDLAEGCRTFLARKDKAHRPDSPDGREISACEAQELTATVVPIRGIGK